MKILCITHADFESPGVIEDWAAQKGYDFIISKPYKGESCFTHTDFEFLIIMGGPQSPLRLDEFSYLSEEIFLIQQAIKQKKRVLGFCLGAQLIGEALGGNTDRSPEKEIGVFPITLTSEGEKDPLFSNFPKTFPVIHWHNDMPGETKESVLLGFSKGCPKQVLRYAPKVYGFQCHLEITREGIQTMIDACPGDLKPSLYTQDADTLLEQNYKTINEYMMTILDRLAKL